MEKLVIPAIGLELDHYVILFNDLKEFYNRIDDENEKFLFCTNLQLWFYRINNKNKDLFKELTNCNYINKQ